MNHCIEQDGLQMPENKTMSSGIVFDIKEFTIHDGPGIRTSVFMKGCPLSCTWCHNPEGQSRQPQVICGLAGERLAGRTYTSRELATLLNRQADILRANEGGITFSGGEPLLQADFVAEVIDLLDDVHVLLDTSGYGDQQRFLRLIERCDLIFFDLKLIDHAAHQHYTGCDNKVILNNLKILSVSGKPFVIRVPLVPGVTDTDENLAAIAQTIRGLPGLLYVSLLPYNQAAGSKYQYAGMEFKPGYDETRPLNINSKVFEQYGMKVSVE
jgi:pyruvate formate lyase activating enzyme